MKYTFRNISLALITVLFITCASLPAHAEQSLDEQFTEDMKNFTPVLVEEGLELARKYMLAERFDLAERIFEAMYAEKPHTYKLYYEYASFLERQGRRNEAIEKLETCVNEVDLFSYDVQVMLGRLYFHEQNYSKAARAYEQAGMVNKIYPKPVFYWGVSLVLQGLKGEPRRAFQLLEKRHPNSFYVPLGWSIYHYHGGEHAKAKEFLDKVDEGGELSAFYWVFKSALYMQLKDYDTAKAALDKALEVDVLYEGILTNQAILAVLSEKNMGKAVKAIETAKEYESFNELIMAEAFVNIRMGKMDEARKALTELLQDGRTLYFANYLMGVIFVQDIENVMRDSKLSSEEKQKKADSISEKAVGYLNYAANGDNNFFPAFFLLAKLQFNRGDFDQALVNFQKASQAMPDNIQVQTFVGHCYLKKNKFNNARKAFEALLQLDDSNTHALNCLGYISAVTGNTQQAEKYFKTTLNIDKRNKYASQQLKKLDDLKNRRER
ncbi:MAG: tetratricopeptide repeat protein [Planctomycetota bacterium]|nr:tetratricopeptide repeat protein [Planctomycetota bacterium]